MKMNRRALVVFHRWLGLIAGAWLLTLGVTGIFLDHDEWRWLHKPSTGGLAIAINDAVSPATVMRYVVATRRRQQLDRRLGARAVDHAQSRCHMGGAIPDGQHPQILRFAKIGLDDQRLVVIATDDGLWIMPEFGGLSDVWRSTDISST